MSEGRDIVTKIPRYLDVAVPLPVRGPFTYRLREAQGGSSEPGSRAVVPVGRRVVTGVIVGRRDAPPARVERVRDVVDLPDLSPALPAQVVALSLWASRYYVSAPGVVLAAALPPGASRRSRTRVSRGAAPPPAGLTPAERRLLDSLPASGSLPLGRIGVPAERLARMQELGLIQVEESLEAARVKERLRRVVALSPGIGPDAASAASPRAPRQQAILRLLASGGGREVGVEELTDRLGAVGPALRALSRRGSVRIRRVESMRAPVVLDAPSAPRRESTPDQAIALASIEQALGSGGGSFLLMGVTGSGKTEVYLRAIESCLQAGRSAIYLVPEIALTPLLARDLKARLGPALSILHSSLSAGERFDEWRRARRGEARIVLGARSAVLAPLERVGLIVVDEEQDGSYKQAEDPRYNARDLALVRARESGGVVILGSATPSIESYHAALSGRHRLLSMPGRIHERPMARVRVVDMREEFGRLGREEVVCAVLKDAVQERLARGEQAILLLNRRGYAPFVLCRSCGASERCLRCSVGLTFHRADHRLRCHYCGYQRGLATKCTTCGSDLISLTGAGTEKLEEQVRELFPEARIARLDRDVARGRRAPAEILSAFEKGEFNLLVGTQMVAKGHDFPGVTIVGVIGADNLLAFPDFRASERTFQLLTQVAGRAGRGSEPGEVIVQAFHRDHYAIETASRQDYASFFEKESRYRRIMKYPPFTVMANVMVQAATVEGGVRRARLAGEVIRAAAGGQMQVVGPAAAPLARLKGRYRYQILVKGSSRRRLSDALNVAAGELAAKGLTSSRDLTIDIDPVNLL